VAPAGANKSTMQATAMSELGQSRHFSRRPTNSGLPLEADIVRAGWYVAKVPATEGVMLLGDDPLRALFGAYSGKPASLKAEVIRSRSSGKRAGKSSCV
jgi:hypothetical protein